VFWVNYNVKTKLNIYKKHRAINDENILLFWNITSEPKYHENISLKCSHKLIQFHTHTNTKYEHIKTSPKLKFPTYLPPEYQHFDTPALTQELTNIQKINADIKRLSSLND